MNMYKLLDFKNNRKYENKVSLKGTNYLFFKT